MNRSRLILAIVLLALLLFSMFGERAFVQNFSYYYAVLMQIGINIILGASLNLVNGYTGQFSLGHAGFMAVGAYASASWSDHLDPIFLNVLGGSGNPFAVNAVFLV